MATNTNADDEDFSTLPPEKLLEGNIHQIEAGLNCIDSVDELQKYLAYENLNQNRSPIQEAIRLRILEVRKEKSKGGGAEQS